MYKDILVFADRAKSWESRQAATIDLANRFDSHVTGLYVVEPVVLPAYAEVAIGAELLQESRESSLNEAKRIGEGFRSKLDHAGVANEWRVVEGACAARTIDNAHYSDIVVMSQQNSEDIDDYHTGLIDDVVLGCGRPVLVLPYIGVPENFGSTILLAWNGSRESVRALHDTMPLLQKAQKVIVMTVNPETDSDHIAGADISVHLARHDVRTVVNSTVSGDIDIGDTLLSRAADEGVDLIVMGGYGHSRFRELVLGGATRHLLHHMTVPVVMSH